MQQPNYTGDEPCVSIGVDMYFFDDQVQADKKHLRKLRNICNRECPLVSECAEYAIHHERHGLWGGLTSKERHAIRRERGITLVEPHVLVG